VKALIKNLWSFASDFGGVISTLLLVLAGVGYVINFLKNAKIPEFLLLVVLAVQVVIMILTFRFFDSYFSKRIRALLNSKEEKSIDQEIKTFQEVSKKVSKLILPSTRALVRLHGLSIKKAKEWSEDAVEEDISMVIDVTHSGVSYRSLTYFYSNWKSQELVIFLPRFSITKRGMEKPIRGNHKPFFKRYPNWNKAVEKASSQIEDELKSNFTLWLYSHYDNFHFRFVIVENEVVKNFEFDFNGKTLKSKDKEVIIK
jgi:hypothetical protein